MTLVAGFDAIALPVFDGECDRPATMKKAIALCQIL
jgi:hypothetical protein